MASTIKSVEERKKELIASGMTEIDAQEEALKEQNAQRAQVYNQQVDASAAKQAEIYEESIRDVERAEKAQLDYNYLDELVGRKNLENTMADMGSTDSGLNRSQQTALTVMRGNADATTRQTAAINAQSLRDAIDQVMIEGEQKKTTYQQELDDAVATWRQEAISNLNTNALSSATESYNAEVEALQTAATDQTANRSTYAMTLIKQGVAEDEAWASACVQYPTGDEEIDLYYAAYKDGVDRGYTGDALKAYANAGGGEAGEAAAGERIAADAHALVENISFEVSGKIWDFKKGTFWRSAGEGDGCLVGEKVEEQLEKNETYKGMSTLEKRAAASFAIAKSVEESFPNESQEANLKRIRRACEEYTTADYNFAVSYYLDNQGNDSPQSKQQVVQNNGAEITPTGYWASVNQTQPVWAQPIAPTTKK